MSYTRTDYALDLMHDLARVDMAQLDPDELEETFHSYVASAKRGAKLSEEN